MADFKPLEWDKTGERLYETGVSQCALYVMNDGAYGEGVAWNGITAINESPSGAESTPLYADNIKYLDLTSAETFGATIEAYTYPDAFAQCDGSEQIVSGVTIGQQKRKSFGIAYKTQVGNDTLGEDFGYKIKLIYGCKASPSERSNSSINESPEATTMSWELTTTPVAVTVAGKKLKPTSTVTIDSTKFTTEAAKAKLEAFEKILYGSDTANARLPLPSEVATLLDVTPAG